MSLARSRYLTHALQRAWGHVPETCVVVLKHRGHGVETPPVEPGRGRPGRGALCPARSVRVKKRVSAWNGLSASRGSPFLPCDPFFLSSSAENPPLLCFRDSNGSLPDGRRVHSRGERPWPKRPLLKCWGGRSCSWLLFFIKMKKPACERRGKGFAPEYDFGGHDSGFRCPCRARSLIRRGAGSRGHGEQGSQRHGDGARALA